VQIELGNVFVGGTLKLHDITGAVVKAFKVESLPVTINVSTLPQGLYLLTAQKDGLYATGKFIVE
jgi:hypothetical protein